MTDTGVPPVYCETSQQKELSHDLLERVEKEETRRIIVVNVRNPEKRSGAKFMNRFAFLLLQQRRECTIYRRFLRRLQAKVLRRSCIDSILSAITRFLSSLKQFNGISMDSFNRTGESNRYDLYEEWLFTDSITHRAAGSWHLPHLLK